MPWSKIKKQIEGFLAESLKKHVKYHFINYEFPIGLRKAWIDFDKEFIYLASDNTYIMSKMDLEHKLRILGGDIEPEYKQLHSPDWNIQEERVKEFLHNQKVIYDAWDFTDVLFAYMSSTIEKSLKSESTLIRAIAMFDRRLGKRRLRELWPLNNEHEFVKKFYFIRCQAEGISFGSNVNLSSE